MPATTTSPRWARPAEVTKHFRSTLRVEFPGVKFSAKTNTYSGGSSVDVRWTGGPSLDAVEAAAKRFAGGRFDGMTA